MRRYSLIFGCSLVLCICPRPAPASLQSCTVAATPVVFGTYVVSSSIALGGTGTVTVTCSVTLVALLESWNIALSTGSSGSFMQRQMTNGSSKLLYNLYTLPSLTTVWGDGTGGSSKVYDAQLLAIGTTGYPYVVYGVLNPLQDMPPGTYTDVITVTVSY